MSQYTPPESPSNASASIQPAQFEPPPEGPQRESIRVRPLYIAVFVLLSALIAALWYVFTAVAVTFDFTPEPDTIDLRGGPSIIIGGNRLARAGRYEVVANKTGYYELREAIEVIPEAQTHFAFELKKLPGRLQLQSVPSDATVLIDGEAAGSTPLVDVKLEAGTHKLLIVAPRYKPFEHDIDIEGKDISQAFTATLEPNWAEVTINSVPEGAVLSVDGEEVGTTPLTAEILDGAHEISLSLDTFRTWTREIAVVAGEPQELPTVELEPAPGYLTLNSEPDAATVTVAGKFAGRTPITVELEPDKNVLVAVSAPGHRTAKQTFNLSRGEKAKRSVRLKPILAQIEFITTPSGATLYVNGESKGSANQTISLPVTEQKVAIKKDGFVDFTTTVTPKLGLKQRVVARLLTPEQARYARLSPRITDPTGQSLVLLRPGEFTMGSERREQGRRANEVQRNIKLTRPFYIGVTEVTNESFQKFREEHVTGIVRRNTLSNLKQPVANVSWIDATNYCNWLSKQEKLPAAYKNGQLLTPVKTGYRLPTEAEWAYAARFAGNKNLKYPWGNSMPPPMRSGNYADESSVGIVRDRLLEYNDGYAGSAPVASFLPNNADLFDIGGNVSEWVNDTFVAMSNSTQVEQDPLGNVEGDAKVVRGSSWRHGRITELRLSWRDTATEKRDDLGFRVARYADNL